jgi:lambda family phage minor tail protein L
MTIANDVQKLEPGSIVELFTLDATSIGGGTVRFQGFHDGNIVWQGNTYAPWPIRAEGFSVTGDQQPTPKLMLGNVSGGITAMCLEYEDMVGAKMIRQRTFSHYLDAVNFPGGINPTADPLQEFPPEIWFVERKASESWEAVEFELSSALNFAGVKLPRRQIIANQCPFVYRGAYCNYVGPPVATELDVPTSNPLLDKCSHLLRGCKLRQWPDGVLNFGGFPAAGLVRT